MNKQTPTTKSVAKPASFRIQLIQIACESVFWQIFSLSSRLFCSASFVPIRRAALYGGFVQWLFRKYRWIHVSYVPHELSNIYVLYDMMKSEKKWERENRGERVL